MKEKRVVRVIIAERERGQRVIDGGGRTDVLVALLYKARGWLGLLVRNELHDVEGALQSDFIAKVSRANRTVGILSGIEACDVRQQLIERICAPKSDRLGGGHQSEARIVPVCSR